MLTIGSLFSGIGGIDLGLERAGMRTRWFVEVDPHCRNVLARHWPGLPIYGDIKSVDWSGVERVDVLAGGFPCQPVSNAGKRLGTDDERWLWPEFARAIRELRPRFVLVENVAALLGRGFGEVIADLAALGYDSEWDCIPASAVGAPHRRDRLWIVAHDDRHNGGASGQGQAQGASAGQPFSAGEPDAHIVADTQRSGQEPLRSTGDVSRTTGGAESAPPQRQRRGDAAGDRGQALAHAASNGRREGWSEPAREQGRPDAPIGGHSGAIFTGLGEGGRPVSDQWLIEPNVGRVADGVPHRVDRLRSLGNAVVPQVVEFIGRRIVAVAEES